MEVYSSLYTYCVICVNYTTCDKQSFITVIPRNVLLIIKHICTSESNEELKKKNQHNLDVYVLDI